MKKKIFNVWFVLFILCLTACSLTKKDENLKTVDFVLDFSPNTNHTGLYVAKELGYFEELGINLEIQLPSEDSVSDLVLNNKASWGIYYQDSMANKLAKGAPFTAVAAVIEHNTSGILSTEKAQVREPKDMVGKTYGTWNDPIELAMMETLLKKQNAEFQKVELVPNMDSNSIAAMENGQFDTAWVFYAWDGIMAKNQGMKSQFFYLKDYAQELDYYTPVIIANNQYLKENPTEAKKILSAIKKGYQYAMEHPEEAAQILMKSVPELKEQEEFVLASQRYLATQYATDKENWGRIDAERWNRFYHWMNENQLTEEPLVENQGFSNEYLKQ